MRRFAAVALLVAGCTCSTPMPEADAGVDLCAKVTCASPPGFSCFEKRGTCDAGVCSYAFADGDPCNDGEVCTANDTCLSGKCAGAPIVCTTPPQRVCSGAAYVAYADAGTCVNGTCAYPATPVACSDGICDGKACGGACVDLSNDPNHCGACGHACLGGGCTTGVCSVATVDGAAHPWLAADESGLYFSTVTGDGGVIGRLRADAGVETLARVPAPLRPWALALDSNAVYVVAFGSDGGAVLAVPKDGGALQVLADEWTPTGIAVEGGQVFWSACESTSSNPARRRIASVPTAGGAVTVLASTGFCPQRVAADADAVYWSELGIDAGLMRVPRDGGAPERLTVTNNTIASILERLALGTSDVWWLSSGGSLVAVPKAGGDPFFTAGDTGALGVDRHAYFLSAQTSPGALKLWKRPADGGTPEVGRTIPGLGAAAVSSCTGLAVGQASVYAACVQGTQWRLVQMAR